MAGFLSATSAGCSSVGLSEHHTPLTVAKRERVSDGFCAILPFSFSPNDPKDVGDLSSSDLGRWQEMLADALDRTNIFAEVVASKSGTLPENAAYSIGGHITEHEFQKNWIPTFFPLHVGLSVLSFTLYTWIGWPTTVTDVSFGIRVELKDVAADRIIGTFEERFRDTSTLNIYSKGMKNPYENPGLAYTHVVDQLATKIALAIPPDRIPRSADVERHQRYLDLSRPGVVSTLRAGGNVTPSYSRLPR